MGVLTLGKHIEFCKLLNDALKYKVEYNEKPLNYFSVSGYPHYENVVSNILSFFFDPEKEHDFGDLWIKSLFECYNEKTNKNYGNTLTSSI